MTLAHVTTRFDRFCTAFREWHMARVTPQFSKGRIDAAGGALLEWMDGPAPFDAKTDEALGIVNNWRSCHNYPLNAITMTLQKRASRVDPKSLTARRIKRLSSILWKLRGGSMRLSQMQDIGGCRAVVRDIEAVDKLIALYEKSDRLRAKSTCPKCVRKSNYIARPKANGYRSIHLICRYQSTHATQHNGRDIEIQIRSALQHAWATAVETAQTFTGQALKSKYGSEADKDWKRFFALMGSAIAAREKCPPVPGTPERRETRIGELRQIQERARIVEQLEGWNTFIKRQQERSSPSAKAFLLVLDPDERMLHISSYQEDQLPEAHAKYLETEQQYANRQQVQVVLVSVDSLAALKRAYPNYFVNSGDFLDAVKREIA